MTHKIICYSVKTTIHIGTEKEVSIHDAFYLHENEAKDYVKIQKSIGNKHNKPWGNFNIEIIPLVNIIPSPCTPEQYYNATDKQYPDHGAVYYRITPDSEWEVDRYDYYINNVKPKYPDSEVVIAGAVPEEIQ